MALQLTENALTVLEKRYLAKDGQGKVVETPEGLFRRVARNLSVIEVLYQPEYYNGDGGESVGVAASVQTLEGYQPQDMETLRRAYERLSSQGMMRASLATILAQWPQYAQLVRQTEEEFYGLMIRMEFMPNSPTLMNAGRDLQQLAACFVLPVEDNLAEIFDTLKYAALIHQSGGGTGFSFSRLRPKNDVVRTSGGVASGPVSFMTVYDAATNAVKQGGTRRGANMGILRVDHPDVLEFIACKQDINAVTNFNISVALTQSFMEAVDQDEDYDLVNPHTGQTAGKLRARDVFSQIVESAWRNGEPGIVFIDRMNADNPTPQLGAIESTNPCGEQPLLPYEACNLGSINLTKFVVPGTPDAPGAFDYPRLGKAVRESIHFLDHVIDANRFPIPQIEKMVQGNRKVGLGVMGWSDALFLAGIPYDSEEAVNLGREIMAFIDGEAKAASRELAAKRGAFPNFPGSVYDQVGSVPLRNATVTTIAPTGTISIIAGASSGIEPIFSLSFTRNVMDGHQLVEVNPVFEAAAKERGFYSLELMERIAQAGTLHHLEEVPADMRRVFVTAHDISPEWHIRMQAAFQEHTDNAVSKTVNFPQEATVEEVAQVYRLAHQLGCKGVTVYRDGSREAQVLQRGKAPIVEEPLEELSKLGHWGKLSPLERPEWLPGFTERKETPLGTMFLTLNILGNHPLEMFAQIGKAGSDVSAFTEAVARLASLALRCGVDPEQVAKQLSGIGGSRSVGYGPNRVRSVPDAMGQFIKEVMGRLPSLGDGWTETAASADGGKDPEVSHPEGKSGGFNICPACGLSTLIHAEGCVKCLSCGYSEC